MSESSADVVIVGGGIAGMTTAYYLAKSGVPSVVIERDAIGSHASGFAYGGLSPLSGFGIPGPMAEIAQDGMRLHRELSKTLFDETGIDVDFRMRSSLALAFSEADVQRLHAALPWRQSQPGYAVRWLDIAEARKIEPRISDETLGARAEAPSSLIVWCWHSLEPQNNSACEFATGARSVCDATEGASLAWCWSAKS
jgi:glycine oxidase